MRTINKIAIKPYTKERKLEAKVNSGFAVTKQKSTLVAVEVMAEAVLFFGSEEPLTIPKGSKAYFKEEDLYANQWARHKYEAEDVEEEFALAEPNYLVMVGYEVKKTK